MAIGAGFSVARWSRSASSQAALGFVVSVPTSALANPLPIRARDSLDWTHYVNYTKGEGQVSAGAVTGSDELDGCDGSGGQEVGSSNLPSPTRRSRTAKERTAAIDSGPESCRPLGTVECSGS